MKEADGNIVFREWLPDLPDLNNPGLIEALNVLPIDGTYTRFYPLQQLNFTVGGLPVGRFKSALARYAASSQNLYMQSGVSSYTVKSANTYNSATGWQFAQYEDLVFAVSDVVLPQVHTDNSASNFATVASAATAKAIGIIGQFVMLGNVGGVINRVRWSAIDDPTNFPTAGSATAIASQSGQQDLMNEFGTVQAISSGDQFGVIIQRRAVTRVTYIGGAAVFQFDRIAENVGSDYPQSVVKEEGKTYFADQRGLYVTDGVSIRNISANKVQKFWQDDHTAHEWRIYAGSNSTDRLIQWGYPQGVGETQTAIISYNYLEDRWTRANQTHYALYGIGRITEAFDSSFQLAQFNPDATAVAAVLTTGEVEYVPGALSRVQGVKPLVDGASANGVTVALGTRDSLATAATFSSETTATARTGFCDFRSEARYHRARLTITGTFNAAQGLEFQIDPSGPV